MQQFTLKTTIIILLNLIIKICCAQPIIQYGEIICHQPQYFCYKIKPHENWHNLFTDAEAMDLVKRINRLNTKLKPGMLIAIPKDLENLSIYEASPFPTHIKSTREKTIYISQKQLAWAAYDEEGELVWWGPISSGQINCKSYGGCNTPTGYFHIIRKQDSDCISTAFPRRGDGDNGGAAMPYCMHFFRGYALHGSKEIPGYHASHGCIRLFIEDARWLNEEFIDLPSGEIKGTAVVID